MDASTREALLELERGGPLILMRNRHYAAVRKAIDYINELEVRNSGLAQEVPHLQLKLADADRKAKELEQDNEWLRKTTATHLEHIEALDAKIRDAAGALIRKTPFDGE